jgi:hypothetical protein
VTFSLKRKSHQKETALKYRALKSACRKNSGKVQGVRISPLKKLRQSTERPNQHAERQSYQKDSARTIRCEKRQSDVLYSLLL